MALCPHTGVTIPECSCSRCIEEQLKRFQPELVDAGRPRSTGRTRPSGTARRLAA
jgi:hypothetical protein